MTLVNAKTFVKTAEHLARSEVGRACLMRFFTQWPYDLVYLSGLLERGGNGALEKTTLIFSNQDAADLNATRGFLKTVRLPVRRVVIWYRGQVSRSLARATFPDFPLTPRLRLSPKSLIVYLGARAGIFLKPNSVILPQSPYKYFGSEGSLLENRSFLRQAMGVSASRKIIVALSPNSRETKALLKSYKKFQTARRPLLVLGLRTKNPGLKDCLTRLGIRAAVREESGSSPNRLWEVEGQPMGNWEVVLLQTHGELSRLLCAADLAIAGEDRNLFEPLRRKIPTLYFPGRWEENGDALKFLNEGIIAINPRRLHFQIDAILKNSDRIVRKATAAVSAFDRQATLVGQFCGMLALKAAEASHRCGTPLLPGTIQRPNRKTSR